MFMNNYFTNRRSVRKFSNKEVNDNLLKEMLKAAACAPTTGGMQLYSVIITRKPEMKAALASAHFSQPAFMNAPVIMTFCADFNRFTHWCKINGANPVFDNLQSFVAAALDTTILAQQFCTIAEQEGLGTCYLGTTTYNAQMIAGALQLPELVVPIITVSVGYPDEADNETDKDRLSVEAFVHDEHYHAQTEEEIVKLFNEKEAREDNKRFVVENNKKTLAQVFTDVRYPGENNIYFSETFKEFLKQQKFI